MSDLTPSFESPNIMAGDLNMKKEKFGWVHCLRCMKDWLSRALLLTGVLPKRCPYCFSYSWNKPYIYKVKTKTNGGNR